MTVPVRGKAVRARADGKFDVRLAAALDERLSAIERDLRGAIETVPESNRPSGGFGGNTTTVVVEDGGGTGEGVTDHLELSGLERDDHPLYLEGGEPAAPRPHVHPMHEILGLVDEIRRLLGIPTPHTHSAEEIHGLQNGVPPPHHVHMPHNPADSQTVLAGQVFGG